MSIDELKSKLSAHQKTVEECNEKIDRLKPAYESLGQVKEQFRSARKSTEAIFEAAGSWRGSKYKAHCLAGDALSSALGGYYSQLDKAQDAINTEISKLRAEKARLLPIIGDLLAQIAALEAEIQNALN